MKSIKNKNKQLENILKNTFFEKNATAPAHPGKKAFEKMIPLGPHGPMESMESMESMEFHGIHGFHGFHGFHGINKNHQNPTKKMYFEKVAPEP